MTGERTPEEQMAHELVKDLSDASIKFIDKLVLASFPFSPTKFPAYYSEGVDKIPVLIIQDAEGKKYAFFVHKAVANALAVSCVQIQTLPLNPAVEPSRILTPQGDIS